MLEDKIIGITNCQECPFCNDDNEGGRDYCNLDTNIRMPTLQNLPDDKVHENCPLKKHYYRFYLLEKEY